MGTAILTTGIVKMLDGNIVQKSYAAPTGTTLYDQVENDVVTNGYGSTFTGEHADKYDGIAGSKNIYYYTVAGHNNVVFAGFCWQIIRTTDTGGVKLLYNGTYSSSNQCQYTNITTTAIGKSSYHSSSYGRTAVGYVLAGGTNINGTTNSTIKTYVDDWYSNNLLNYTDYLEDTMYCNERSGGTNSPGYSSGTNWAGNSSSSFLYRNYSNPLIDNLTCYNELDRFSVENSKAELKYPVALITANEWVLNKNWILNTENSNFQYWTMTPSITYSGGESEVFRTMSAAFAPYQVMGDDAPNVSMYVRPVISISNCTEVNGGSGSIISPYIIDQTNGGCNMGSIPISYVKSCFSLANYSQYAGSSSIRTATFYYQKSTTNGQTQVATVTDVCVPESGESSCTVNVPFEVGRSVGTYNNSYAGLSTQTGTMNTNVQTTDNKITISEDTIYYAVYSDEVTNYYYGN